MSKALPPRKKKASGIPASAALRDLGGVLARARKAPVVLTKNGKPAAVMLSAARYRRMQKLQERLQEDAEDRELMEMALKAEKEGTIGAEATEKFLRSCILPDED